MSTFAVIESSGKQYRVEPEKKIKIDVGNDTDGAVSFEKVLLRVKGDDVEIGTPYIEGAIVRGAVTNVGHEKTKIVFRYHSKTRYRKKKGHRQKFCEVKILGV